MTVHVLISGIVQGVGFRQFIRYKAKKIGVTGWIKNREDRKVEAELSGSQEKLLEMILYCKKGPFVAEVSDIKIEWKKKEVEYKFFFIV